MIGDANLSGRRKGKVSVRDRGPAIFALILIGGTLLVITAMAIAELL